MAKNEQRIAKNGKKAHFPSFQGDLFAPIAFFCVVRGARFFTAAVTFCFTVASAFASPWGIARSRFLAKTSFARSSPPWV